mmetsp:Transcript_5591/g.17997  ORF Transcript_5591/g.17997 Transcript_5591/m.17997 type:complete len:250 (-) Transcript_5591:367-1116(-)
MVVRREGGAAAASVRAPRRRDERHGPLQRLGVHLLPLRPGGPRPLHLLSGGVGRRHRGAARGRREASRRACRRRHALLRDARRGHALRPVHRRRHGLWHRTAVRAGRQEGWPAARGAHLVVGHRVRSRHRDTARRRRLLHRLRDPRRGGVRGGVFVHPRLGQQPDGGGARGRRAGAGGGVPRLVRVLQALPLREDGRRRGRPHRLLGQPRHLRDRRWRQPAPDKWQLPVVVGGRRFGRPPDRPPRRAPD